MSRRLSAGQIRQLKDGLRAYREETGGTWQDVVEAIGAKTNVSVSASGLKRFAQPDTSVLPPDHLDAVAALLGKDASAVATRH